MYYLYYDCFNSCCGEGGGWLNGKLASEKIYKTIGVLQYVVLT